MILPENPVTAKLLFRLLTRIEDHLGLPAIAVDDKFWSFSTLTYEVQLCPNDNAEATTVDMKVFRRERDGVLALVFQTHYIPQDTWLTTVEADITNALAEWINVGSTS